MVQAVDTFILALRLGIERRAVPIEIDTDFPLFRQTRLQGEGVPNRWRVVFPDLRQAEFVVLRSTWFNTAGVQPFNFTPPGESATKGFFVGSSFRARRVSQDHFQVTAEIEEVVE